MKSMLVIPCFSQLETTSIRLLPVYVCIYLLFILPRVGCYVFINEFLFIWRPTDYQNINFMYSLY